MVLGIVVHLEWKRHEEDYSYAFDTVKNWNAPPVIDIITSTEPCAGNFSYLHERIIHREIKYSRGRGRYSWRADKQLPLKQYKGSFLCRRTGGPNAMKRQRVVGSETCDEGSRVCGGQNNVSDCWPEDLPCPITKISRDSSDFVGAYTTVNLSNGDLLYYQRETEGALPVVETAFGEGRVCINKRFSGVARPKYGMCSRAYNQDGNLYSRGRKGSDYFRICHDGNKWFRPCHGGLDPRWILVDEFNEFTLVEDNIDILAEEDNYFFSKDAWDASSAPNWTLVVRNVIAWKPECKMTRSQFVSAEDEVSSISEFTYNLFACGITALIIESFILLSALVAEEIDVFLYYSTTFGQLIQGYNAVASIMTAVMLADAREIFLGALDEGGCSDPTTNEFIWLINDRMVNMYIAKAAMDALKVLIWLVILGMEPEPILAIFKACGRSKCC